MIKRPQFILNNEEKLADAEETRGAHKGHHHSSKGHASRHHKKYDKTAHTTADHVTSTTAESITKFSTIVSDERVPTTEGKLDKYSDMTPVEARTTAETTGTTETLTVTNVTTGKAKKPPRRQKIKETPTNRTETEEDKPQRRRKTHHHRRNNTLLTNSVHDDVVARVIDVNVSDINDATSSTKDPTTRDRHNHNQHRFTTVPITTTETTTVQQGIADASKNGDYYFNSDRTTEPIVVTELVTSNTMTSVRATETSRTSPVASKSTSLERSRTMPDSTISVTMPTTTLPVRRYPKVQKNRTSEILGPARIDVTIIEPPDRKHKQGATKINIK